MVEHSLGTKKILDSVPTISKLGWRKLLSKLLKSSCQSMTWMELCMSPISYFSRSQKTRLSAPAPALMDQPHFSSTFRWTWTSWPYARLLKPGTLPIIRGAQYIRCLMELIWDASVIYLFFLSVSLVGSGFYTLPKVRYLFYLLIIINHYFINHIYMVTHLTRSKSLVFKY